MPVAACARMYFLKSMLGQALLIEAFTVSDMEPPWLKGSAGGLWTFLRMKAGGGSLLKACGRVTMVRRAPWFASHVREAEEGLLMQRMELPRSMEETTARRPKEMHRISLMSAETIWPTLQFTKA